MAYDPELAHASTYLQITEAQEAALVDLAETADVRNDAGPARVQGTGINVRTILPYYAGVEPTTVEPVVQVFEWDLDCMAALVFSVSPPDARKLAHALLRCADLADYRRVQPSVQAVLEGLAR